MLKTMLSLCLMVRKQVQRGTMRLIIVLANKNLALNSVAGAAFGAAGQRCMALSVGASRAMRDRIHLLISPVGQPSLWARPGR